MALNESNVVFKIFDEWIVKKGYQGTDKFTKKELGKMFDTEIKNLGENIGNCKDLNSLKKKLNLSYVDEDGVTHCGYFTMKDFKFEENNEEDEGYDPIRETVREITEGR